MSKPAIFHPGSGFRCATCRAPSVPHEKPVQRVVETRAKKYVNGTHGTEIVRQVMLCSSCATIEAALDQLSPMGVAA